MNKNHRCDYTKINHQILIMATVSYCVHTHSLCRSVNRIRCETIPFPTKSVPNHVMSCFDSSADASILKCHTAAWYVQHKKCISKSWGKKRAEKIAFHNLFNFNFIHFYEFLSGISNKNCDKNFIIYLN